MTSTPSGASMDAELKAYLDHMKDGIARQFEAMTAHIDARFDQLEERMDRRQARRLAA
jgi:hypothetical protein